MRRKPLILLLLMVGLPMIGLAWLGVRVARDDEATLQQRFEEVYAIQLRDIDGTIRRHFESLSTELRATAGQVVIETDQIRALLRDQPKVRQIIVLDDEGMLLHPNPALPLNSGERDFLSEARELISDRDLIRAAALSEEIAANRSQNVTPAIAFKKGAEATFSEGSEGTAEGWYAWYWGRGVHLIFWQRRADGAVVGILVERGRWMADLIAALPETVDREYQEVPVETTSRFRLVDSMGHSLYEWGGFEPPPEASPLVERAVTSPLTSWRLQALVPDSLLTGADRGASLQLAFAIGGAAVALAVLAIFFWREYSREVRRASQRVSFVNQVSHELKTPLTNIRMYADLLADDLEGLDGAV